MRAPVAALAVLVLAAVALPAAAQQRPDTAHASTGRIIGFIVDAVTKRPIEDAAVRLTDSDRFAGLTDSRGRFAFSGVPRGVNQLLIEHLAYGRGTHLINVPPGETVTFEAELTADALRLDTLVITARVTATQLQRSGFHERARRGFGYFFSGGEASSLRIREILYSVPRLEIAQAGLASQRRVVLRTPRGPCVPEIFLDGVRQQWAQGDIETVVVGLDIEAIEVYRGMDTPAQFLHNPRFAPCGAIVVWTRR